MSIENPKYDNTNFTNDAEAEITAEKDNESEALKETAETDKDTAGVGKDTKAITQKKVADNRMRKKKLKKVFKTIIIVIAILIIAVFILAKAGVISKLCEKYPPLKSAIEKVNFTIPVINFEVNLSEWFSLNEAGQENQVTTYTVGTRSITDVLTSTGTIEPNDQYSVTSLVSGEILGDYFQEGDTVIEDQILYTIDSDNLDSSITRAENNLKNANKSLDNALKQLEKLDIKSDYTGTIKKIYVENGDDINAGAPVADIVDDWTMCIDIPFLDVDCSLIRVGDTAVLTFNETSEELYGKVTEIGTVTSINNLGVSVRKITISVNNTGSITPDTIAYARIGDMVCTSESNFYYNDEGTIYAEVSGEVEKIHYKEGDRIHKDGIIVSLSSEDLEDQVEKLRDNVKEAEDSLQDARDAYDDYSITAPITGKVISKEYKTGDTLSSGGQSGSKELAVIYDMSALKFTMSIDELDIDKIDEGQEVIVTCDSRAGKEYKGTITNISIQGTTTSGTTVYPVEVTIRNLEDETKRTVSDDGTINKVYMTGMTSTVNEYNAVSVESQTGSVTYKFSDDIIITKVIEADGSFTLYDGEIKLNKYINDTYTAGAKFYSFSDDFSVLNIEIQNDKQMLRPGMNVDAEIIVEKRENVIAIPISAVSRGNVVKVIKDGSSKKNTESGTIQTPPSFDINNPPENMDFDIPENIPENMPSDFPEDIKMPSNDANDRSRYGTADKDVEFEEVRVTIGISDDSYVEIKSGLNEGDIIIIETQAKTSSQNTQFGMMGGMPTGMGGGMMGGMPPSGMGGGGMPSGGMSGRSGGMGR